MEDFYETICGGPRTISCFVVGECSLIKLEDHDSLVVAIRVIIGTCSRDDRDEPSRVES